MTDFSILQPGNIVETVFGVGTILKGPFRPGGSCYDRMITVSLKNSTAYIAECFWNTVKAVIAPPKCENSFFFTPIYFSNP